MSDSLKQEENAFVLIFGSDLVFQALSLTLNLLTTQFYSATIILINVCDSPEEQANFSDLLEKTLMISQNSGDPMKLKIITRFVSNQEFLEKTYNFSPNLELLRPRLTYLRFFLESLIPYNFKRLLYLDIDVLVLDDLKELFQRNFSTVISASLSESLILARGEHLVDHNSMYFNDGVILIDFEKWKSEQIENQLIGVAKSGPFVYLDQDVFNIVFKDSWTLLDKRFNFLQEIQLEDFSTRSIQNPAIVHFVGAKPWGKTRMSSYVTLYRQNFNKIRPIHPYLMDIEED
jgi:lipopolysaccharide biosynthesis glycosyltransferase